MLAAGDVDYIDPGAAYYQFSYMVDSATQRQLQSWQPADVEKPTPDIAEGPPKISDDGKDMQFTIKSGIKYSPPVNREVKCDDFKYAIERSLLPGVANGYVTLYLTDVVGFADAQKAAQQDPTTAPDISGITCNGNTLDIKLTDTSSAGVIGALSLPIGSPVPREYASKFDSKNPSTYGDHQVATGPYMIQNDSSRASSPATPPARRSSWSATRTGTRRRTRARRTWTRSRSRRASRTPIRRPRRSSRAIPRSTATSRSMRRR